MIRIFALVKLYYFGISLSDFDTNEKKLYKVLLNENKTAIICPWCRHEVTIMVFSKTLRMDCKKCKMSLFVVKLPQGEVLANYKARRLIL